MAESVFIAGMFVKYGRQYTELLRKLELHSEADAADAEITAMVHAAETSGWDGEWFIRAFDAESNPVGSRVCDEGKIYIEPQGMCVMAGIGTEDGKAAQALESVEKYLDTPYGICLLQPAYTVYHKELGEITSYPPGYKENAGIFCHNNPWIACAETVLGHGTRAFEVFKKTCPIYLEDISEVHRTEPYAYCQMVAGPDAPTFGEGKNSWLTGTAAWTFTCISQYILGIHPILEGLQIDPCIPGAWSGFSVDRIFRGVTYHISVENPSHVEKGVKTVEVDGTPISGNVLTESIEKQEVSVRIIMG